MLHLRVLLGRLLPLVLLSAPVMAQCTLLLYSDRPRNWLEANSWLTK
jgi:hypothetical protein